MIAECLKLLTEDKKKIIAQKVAQVCKSAPDNLTIRSLKKSIKEAEEAIENLWNGIEQGQSVDMLTERINQRTAQKKELENQLAIEEHKRVYLNEAQVLAFLDYVCETPFDDFEKRRAIINIFVNAVYLYDDHFTILINASKKLVSVENIPFDEIEAAFEGENNQMEGCSSATNPVPPKRKSCRYFSAGFSFCIIHFSLFNIHHSLDRIFNE